MENKIISGAEYYPKYKADMIDLYIEAFYEKKSSEMLRKNIGSYFDQIFDIGYGIFSINDSKLNGLILVVPPEFDKHLPEEISNTIDIQNSLYIAEVFISKSCRGKGYGKQLMTSFFENAGKEYKAFIIRVLKSNDAAISLYEKFSFVRKQTFLEEKINFSGNKTVLDKLYLVKEQP